MSLKNRFLLAIAMGLLALGGWKAYLRLGQAPVRQIQVQPKGWICPMRCLDKTYDHDGRCDVCGMKLVPLKPKETEDLARAQAKGWTCPMRLSTHLFQEPGRCPFCHLELRPYTSSEPVKAGVWPELSGKSAIYLRPYEVKPVSVLHLVRGAGRLHGRRLELRLDREQLQGIAVGASAMVSPPQGYAKRILGTVASLRSGGLSIQIDRDMPGISWATAEIRVGSAPLLAVPLQALDEADGVAGVFVAKGTSFEPRRVTITVRGETLAAVSGLEEGDVVAGSGVFWLQAQWRMDHPEKATQ